MTTQVNFFCHFNVTGVGRHSENAFFAMSRNRPAGLLPIYVNQLQEDAVERAVRASRPETDLTLFFWRYPAPFVQQFQGQRILWWFFESDRLPAKWLADLQPYDQIWAPSAWAQQVLLAHGVAAERVRVVESGVSTPVFRPASRVARDGFVFLSVGKYEKRKSIDETVEAFQAEFPLTGHPLVELWLKADFPLFPDRVKQLASRCAHDPRIKVISGEFSDEQMAELYRSADAFVFPSKAEGFGLPLLEAIACGIPAIATHCSAQTAFLDHIPGLYAPVAWTPAPIVDDDYAHFYAADYGSRDFGSWALPSVAALREAMRAVYAEPHDWRARAMEAAQIVREAFSWDMIGRKALQEITRLRERAPGKKAA